MVFWDPAQYARFARFRSRPFADLVDRIQLDRPGSVVDLGCGDGELTVGLLDRWPGTEVLGIDSSPQMLADAPTRPGLTFREQRIEDFRPAAGIDVVISNAALQWVPAHRKLLDLWLAELAAGAWLAVQVPGNFDAPSHALLREIAARPQWAAAGSALRADAVDEPAAYAERLVRAGWVSDVWETTYLHALTGEAPVLEWMRGSGLRPVVQALPPDDRADFEDAYAGALAQAYPAVDGVTLLPFRRIFVVGHRPS